MIAPYFDVGRASLIAGFAIGIVAARITLQRRLVP